MSTKNKGNNPGRTVLWFLLLGILMIGSAVLVPYLREGGQALRPTYLVPAAVLAVGALAFGAVVEPKTREGFRFWLIPLAYLISVAFLLLFDRPFTFPFWTFGGLRILCALKLRFGMFMNIYLLYVIGSLQTALVSEVLIVQVLCLILFGFVMPHAKVWKDAVNILVSVAAVLISVRIVCYFTMDKSTLTNDIFCVAVVYAVVICAVLLLSKGLQETVLLQEQSESFEFLEELAAGAEEQDAHVSEYIAMTEGTKAEDTAPEDAGWMQALPGEELPNLSVYLEKSMEDAAFAARLDALTDEAAPLLMRFSQKYPKAFLHVRRVALFAAEVAEQMEDVNPTLVKCAGYYHEIGRLRGEKSLTNTLAVAMEEDFPQALQNVLREHTTDGDKPTSKEAALLLLTDNICGMCEHLKKTQKGTILISKVIEKALTLRLAKGDFNRSGLTAADLAVIRNTMVEVIKEDMF